MTEIAEVAEQNGADESSPRRRKGSGLDAMVLPELKQLAQSLGLRGTGGMRKGQLVDAIRSAQGGGSSSSGSEQRERSSANRGGENRGGENRATENREERSAESNGHGAERTERREERREETGSSTNGHSAPSNDRPAEQPTLVESPAEGDQQGRDGQSERRRRNRDQRDTNDQRGNDQQRNNDQQRGNDQRNNDQRNNDQQRGNDQRGQQNQGQQNQGQQPNQNRDGNERNDRGNDRNDRNDRGNDQRGQQRDQQQRGDYDDDGGSRRSRRRRNRDRQNRRGPTRTGGGGMDRYEADTTVSEDDVLVPVMGILDVLDNYAFVRTNGYLPGPDDAYVSLSMVKKFGLRKGDVLTGALRAPRDSDRKEKFNPLVRIDSINNDDPEAAKGRAEFGKLTPLYPQEKLRLETTANQVTGRIIDLLSPVGKGQRGLIVSPPKAGKTMAMQQIANAIATNNPEVHLMVVLVDERPEEVTDFQRSVKGEVIASTFDRPADDHTTVAELAIERAKRLVEMGRDVVILLDGITRLSRAYNIAAPASGRILSGGVDSAALYPPKKFFGAARNVEGGGSLTILATALVETGSKMDEVIFEEFKGTGNMELRFRRDIAEKRIFPAIDVDASSTRREELLMSREELSIVWKLRRVLSGLESLQGLEMLLDRLRKTSSNGEFLMAITKSIPGGNAGRAPANGDDHL